MPSMNILCLRSSQQTCDCCGGRVIHPASAPPTLLNLKPVSVAQQLTLLEWAMFSKIEPINILDRGRKLQTHGESADIKAVINISNKISLWVARTVLDEENVDKRARIVEHFIDIADACRTLSNLSGMTALYASLNAPVVARLGQTWARVGKKHMKLLGRFRAMIHPYLVLGKAKGMHQSLKPPCVPFIGVYMTAARQSPPSDTRSTDGEIVREVQKWQRTAYNLKRDEHVEMFLREQLEQYHTTESEYWMDRSRKREPDM